MVISFDFSIDFDVCKMYIFLLKKKGMKSINFIEKKTGINKLSNLLIRINTRCSGVVKEPPL